MRSPSTTAGEYLLLTATREKPPWRQRPSTVKSKQNYFLEKESREDRSQRLKVHRRGEFLGMQEVFPIIPSGRECSCTREEHYHYKIPWGLSESGLVPSAPDHLSCPFYPQPVSYSLLWQQWGPCPILTSMVPSMSDLPEGVPIDSID